MSEEYNVFELTELNRLSCVCKCGVEVTIQIEPDSEPSFSNKCPACDNSLYPMSDVLEAIREYSDESQARGAPRETLFSTPQARYKHW